jgi:predicted PurR-regulated permease PerM
MNPNRPLIFWIATLALIVVMVVLLREVLLPFVAGSAFAYLLNPHVSKLERFSKSRAAATLLILGIFFIAVVVFLVLAIPILGAEVAALIDNLPVYLQQLRTIAADPSHPWIGKIVGVGASEAQQSSGELSSMGARWAGEWLRSLWSDGRRVVSIVSLVVVTPIVTAYLVHDWNRIIAALDAAIPGPHRNAVRALAREIDAIMTSFLRGQGTICLILAMFYALALRSIGLNHGLLICLVAGLLGFVPYLGSLTGLLLSVSVAFLQFGMTWTPILFVLGIFFIDQSLADYVLAPVLVAGKVHLNPVWLLFALFSFGYLFGFVGLLIAVPLAASIGVLVRFALRQNIPSPIDANLAQSGAEVDQSASLPRPPLQ